MSSDTNPVTSDGILLVQTFISKQSVAFSDFRQAWKELTFPLVYWAGSDGVQKTEMIQLLLEVGVRYACAEEELTNRVAGLYLLYSVYFTQPCSPRVLIRLTLEYWTAMQQLHAELRSNKVHEADYALCLLKIDCAFSFCCTPQPMCMTNWSVEPSSSTLPQLTSVTSSPLTPITQMQQDVDKESCEYMALKQKLADFLPPHLLQEKTD